MVGAELLKPYDAVVERGDGQDVGDGQQVGEDQIKVLLVDGVKKVGQSFI